MEKALIMYRYLGCGLDNVLLRNGYEIRQTGSGREVVAIQDVEGLHKAIADNLCALGRALKPKEFKFLRKEMDLTQRQVAMMTGVTEQTVSLWERGESAINAAAERILRSLMKETLSGNAELRLMLQQFCELDREERNLAQENLEFEADPNWRLAA